MAELHSRGRLAGAELASLAPGRRAPVAPRLSAPARGSDSPFVAVIAAFTSSSQGETTTARLILSTSGERTLARLCKQALTSPLVAQLHGSDLSHEVVTIRIPPGACQESAQSVQLRTSMILAAQH